MGRVWRLGDNVDTDVITPTEYLNNKEDYVNHALEPVRPEFADEVREGDVIVADKNFGCGSSRETAPVALLENGIEAVVAESFARIFYRNSINIGLPVYVCPDATEVDDGDEVSIDHENAIVFNHATDCQYEAEAHPEFIREVLELGGLKYFWKKLREKGN